MGLKCNKEEKHYELFRHSERDHSKVSQGLLQGKITTMLPHYQQFNSASYQFPHCTLFL